MTKTKGILALYKSQVFLIRSLLPNQTQEYCFTFYFPSQYNYNKMQLETTYSL